MDSILLYLHPVMRCCTYPTHRKQQLGPRIGKSFLIIRDNTPNGPSAFSTRRDDIRFVSSSVKTNKDEGDGNAPLRSRKEKDRLARQEEIISLFRRIKSSISKGEKTGTEDEIPEDDKEKPAAESVLEIIRRSRKKANQANKEKKTKSNTVRKMLIPTTPKKDKEVEPIPNLEVPRLPSNFVKKSPIPFPSSPRGKSNEPGELEGAKLAELKALAKSRGLKGYSKLKKAELMHLLLSHS